MTRPWRVALGLAVVAGSCGSGAEETQTGLSVGTEGVLEQFDIAGIAADPKGGGWLLEDVDGTTVVNHLDSQGVMEKTAELPWVRTRILGLPDGRLVAVGVRCEQDDKPVEDCGTAVVEIAWVSADGEVSDPALISTHEARPEDVTLRIDGSADDSLWLSAQGDMFAIGDDRRVEQQIEGVGNPCVIDDGIYLLSESGRPEVATPTADPEHPVTYSVSALTDSTLAAVEGGRFEGPSNSLGQCTGSGFETYVSTKTESARWTPTKGWFEVERALDPLAPRSTHALGLLGDEFIVDENGSLLVRNEAAAWEPTGITFESTRSKDGPPLVLFADRSGGAFIGCMSIEPEDPDRYGLECLVGGAQ